jgi:hypothetical protein
MILVLAILSGLFFITGVVFFFEPELRLLATQKEKRIGTPIAVLGDSDSHTYSDNVLGVRRGGVYHEQTYQWTEVWNALRPQEVDFGPWGIWGTRSKVASLRAVFGLPARVMKKNDFRYNFAKSGCRCDSLFDTYPFQASSLLSLLEARPGLFDYGLVFIRIGINDFGQKKHLQAWAKTGLDKQAEETVGYCLEQIEKTVQSLLLAIPTINVILVDISHNYNAGFLSKDTFTPNDSDGVLAVLNHYTEGLKKNAGSNERVAYVDDVWHRNRWGDRFQGNLQMEVFFGGKHPIRNDRGDEPFNLTLNDGHASTVNNGLWLQHAIVEINRQLGLKLTEISELEILTLSDPENRFQMRPSRSSSLTNP